MARRLMTEGSITLYPPFRTRTFSTYHDIQGLPDRVAQIARSHRRKRYPLGLTVRYPMRLYTRVKYGQRDIIEYAGSALDSLPEILAEFLPPRRQLVTTTGGRTALVCGRVVDHDGSPSRFLNDAGAITDPSFRSEVLRFADLLRSHRLYLMSAFEPGNLLVRRTSDRTSRPVLWPDVLKQGRTLYPLQWHLLSGPVLRRKFERRLERFLNDWVR